MDNTESSIKHLKNIIRDVSERLKTRSEDFKIVITKYKENCMNKKKAFAIEKSRLANKLQELHGIEQNLIAKKTLLSQSLEKEDNSLVRTEKENQTLLENIRCLEMANKELLEKEIDSEEKERMLTGKYKMIKERSEAKFKEQKSVNDKFKLFFGLDIVKIKDNIIKIVFNNIGPECFVIIDFGLSDCVSCTQPELNLEKLNYAFKEKASFYDFIKYVREQLKQKV